jgi:predicted transcriptional regulator
MQIQRKILREFNRLYGDLSIKKKSEVTGIQTTRMFRLLKGAEMKVGELEKLQEAICIKRDNRVCTVLTLAHKCSYELSGEALKEVCSYLQRRLRLTQILDGGR